MHQLITVCGGQPEVLALRNIHLAGMGAHGLPDRMLQRPAKRLMNETLVGADRNAACKAVLMNAAVAERRTHTNAATLDDVLDAVEQIAIPLQQALIPAAGLAVTFRTIPPSARQPVRFSRR